MVTGVLARIQRSGEVGGDDVLGRLGRRADDHLDPVLREQPLSPLAHAAGDNHVGPLLVQPTGQDARLMRWRRQVTGVGYGFAGRLPARAPGDPSRTTPCAPI